MIDDERLLTMDDKWRCRLSDILLKLVCAHITIRQPKEADETLDNQNPTKHANISVNNAVNIKMYSYLHLLHFHVFFHFTFILFTFLIHANIQILVNWACSLIQHNGSVNCTSNSWNC